MATPDWSCVSKENLNFSRLCKLLVDGGTKVLREVFDSIHPPASLRSHLVDPINYGKLKKLQSKKILYMEQWKKLYPTDGSTVDSKSFDITLLSLLLRSICNLPTPTGGWNYPPAPTSTNKEDDVVRIKLYRNQVYGHITEAAIADSEFTKCWNDISGVLVRLGGAHYQQDIDELRVVSMDPEDLKYYTQCLKEWATNEDRIMKALDVLTEKVDEAKHELTEKVDEAKHELTEKVHEVREKVDEVGDKVDEVGEKVHEVGEKVDEVGEKLDKQTHELHNVKEKIEEIHQEQLKQQTCCITRDDKEYKLNVELFSKNLKFSTKQQTEFQPKLMASHSFSSARTDDIFTNLTIQHGRKPLKEHLYGTMIFDSNQMISTPIKTCQEIFIRSEEDTSSAKSILVFGKPGIGKTLFCQKLVRDWANDELFTNESNTASVGFDFVYLLTFHHLNLLEDKELNLRELLNLLPLLDEHSNIDESLFEYIIEHPENVLFILDGYDEYASHSNIEGNLEEKYANNPRDRMPVDALVSKLIRKKVFTNATVMVTSRPQEADRLGSIHFDALAEVAGFSPEQVNEFIGKHFQSKPKIANRVLEHIMNNESVLSTAHIPMLCFLMCLCLEWQIESNVENNLPNTRTELYSQVVRIFEMKHHSKSEFRTAEIPEQFQVPPVVKDTLDKLSKLAAETMVGKKLIFQEADLQKFSISSEEAELLKGSGLLTCGPGIKPTAFTITRYYCFSHLTLHEYFAACDFVKNNEVPPTRMVQRSSSLVPQFMSGLLGRERNEITMEQLMQAVILQNDVKLSAICLFEYNDKQFGVRMIRKYHHCFCTKEEPGYLYCGVTAEVDQCAAVSYFLNLLSEFNRENKTQERKTSSPEPFLINGLCCWWNNVYSAAVVKHIFDSLKNQFCPITSLVYFVNSFPISGAQKCLECLMETLPSTNITTLCFRDPLCTNKRLGFLCKALVSTKITNLRLELTPISDVELQHLNKWIQSSNIDTLELRVKRVDDKMLQCLCEVLVRPTNTTKLYLDNTHITDGGLEYLSQALPSSNITALKMDLHNTTDVGLQYLCDKLPTTSITSLDIVDSAFTDVGLQYLSDVLPSTNIDTLNIKCGKFTDVGLQYLCEKLPSTKITKLNFSGDRLTDVGLQYLIDVLPFTRISALELRYDVAVTDVGLQCLSKALLSTEITTLVLHSRAITDVGLDYLSKSLPSTNITTLELYCKKYTDKGLLYISEALAKLTTLKLGSDCITASGLQHLSKALQSSAITKLDLSEICGIKNINLRFLCELLPSMKIITAFSLETLLRKL